MAHLTEAQKKKLMIADNRIFELGSSNLEVLDEFLNELVGDLDVPGYDEETLQMMVGDIEAVNEQIAEYGRLEKEKVNEIVKTQDALERKIENEKKLAEDPVKEDNNSEQTTTAEVLSTSSEDKDQGNYVICPKCGEKIWVL